MTSSGRIRLANGGEIDADVLAQPVLWKESHPPTYTAVAHAVSRVSADTTFNGWEPATPVAASTRTSRITSYCATATNIPPVLVLTAPRPPVIAPSHSTPSRGLLDVGTTSTSPTSMDPKHRRWTG